MEKITLFRICIYRPNTDHIGLFGYTSENSNISNVFLENINITGSWCVGSLIGWNLGNVFNSHSTGYVEARSLRIGGLIGINGGLISNSYANVKVNGTMNTVGGFVGYNLDGTIINSNSIGNVFGNSFVGGFIGVLEGNVSNSHSTGNVIGNTNNVGGFIGSIINGLVLNSHSTGNVNAGWGSAGGFAGENRREGEIINSYSTGNVIGDNNIGGFLGANGGIISKSYATGNATALGTGIVGGFVGQNYAGKISNSFSTGTVGGTVPSGSLGGGVGGFIGWGYHLIVSNCYTLSKITSSGGSHGGFIGSPTVNTTFISNFWNEDTAGSHPSLNTIGATKSNTTAMQNPQTYIDAGWNGSIWNLISGNYPTHN